jgi:predicted RNA-binding protein
MLCEYVSNISVGGGIITLTDLMGRELTVSGSLQSVDLVKNAITIRAGEAEKQEAVRYLGS